MINSISRNIKMALAAALWSVSLAGLASAQDPPGPGPQRRPPDDRPGIRGGPVDQFEPSEADFRAAEEAMRQHAPNWWRRFDNAPPGAPIRRRMMRAVVERHRELQRIKQRDPEQHAREIRQLELEDEILGLAPRIWREREGSSAETEELKSELKNKLGELIDLRIQNREERLQRLTQTLEAEKRRLEVDKRDRDKTVDQRYEAVLNRRLDQVFPGGRGLRGGGGAGGGGPDAVLGPPPGPDQRNTGPPPRGPRPDRRERDGRPRGEDNDRGPGPPLPPPPPVPPDE